MARWNEGYVADVTYTTNFFREMTPAWLAMAAVLLGHRPPDLSRPFRWAELGCGNGFTAAVIAAACPMAEVWAFDFNPAHIETAQRLADRAGLGNITYREASFEQLADAPEAALPAFDFIAAHGVYSWVAPEHRRQIVSFVERRLRPGGLFYNSYNDAVGWATMIPLQRLMQVVTRASQSRSDLAVPQINGLIARLMQGQAGFFVSNAAIEGRLQMLRTLDARYLAHEYLNEHWHPLMFVDVAAEIAEAKSSYIGSATLTDNMDATSAPPALLPLMAETLDVGLKETLRDFANAQSFRRDIYRRGVTGLNTGEHLDLIDALTLTPLALPIADDVEIEFRCGIGTVTGDKRVYGPLLDALTHGPLTMAVARTIDGNASKPVSEMLQAFGLLASGGYAHPAMPGGATSAGFAACRALNRAIAGMNAEGASVANLASPVIGAAIPSGLVETLVVGELLAGCDAERDHLVDTLVAILARTGRRVRRDGAPISDPAAVRQTMLDGVSGTLGPRGGLLRALGVLAG